jgi:hypothetical protein
MTLTVRLPETIESQLTRFCEAMGVSKSQVVLGALKEWFAKPPVVPEHPLLAFVDASVKSPPGAGWAGPYSKDRLRERVLASGQANRVSESVAPYAVAAPAQTSISPSKAAKKVSKRKSPKQPRQVDAA